MNVLPVVRNGGEPHQSTVTADVERGSVGTEKHTSVAPDDPDSGAPSFAPDGEGGTGTQPLDKHTPVAPDDPDSGAPSFAPDGEGGTGTQPLDKHTSVAPDDPDSGASEVLPSSTHRTPHQVTPSLDPPIRTHNTDEGARSLAEGLQSSSIPACVLDFSPAGNDDVGLPRVDSQSELAAGRVSLVGVGGVEGRSDLAFYAAVLFLFCSPESRVQVNILSDSQQVFARVLRNQLELHIRVNAKVKLFELRDGDLKLPTCWTLRLGRAIENYLLHPVSMLSLIVDNTGGQPRLVDALYFFVEADLFLSKLFAPVSRGKPTTWPGWSPDGRSRDEEAIKALWERLPPKNRQSHLALFTIAANSRQSASHPGFHFDGQKHRALNSVLNKTNSNAADVLNGLRKSSEGGTGTQTPDQRTSAANDSHVCAKLPELAWWAASVLHDWITHPKSKNKTQGDGPDFAEELRGLCVLFLRDLFGALRVLHSPDPDCGPFNSPLDRDGCSGFLPGWCTSEGKTRSWRTLQILCLDCGKPVTDHDFAFKRHTPGSDEWCKKVSELLNYIAIHGDSHDLMAALHGGDKSLGEKTLGKPADQGYCDLDRDNYLQHLSRALADTLPDESNCGHCYAVKNCTKGLGALGVEDSDAARVLDILHASAQSLICARRAELDAIAKDIQKACGWVA